MYRLFSYADLLLVPYLGDFQLFFFNFVSISIPPLFTFRVSNLLLRLPQVSEALSFFFFYLFSKLVCSQVYSSIICNVVLSQSSVVLKKKYFTLFFSTILSVVLEKNHCPIVSVAVSSQCCLPLIVFSLQIFSWPLTWQVIQLYSERLWYYVLRLCWDLLCIRTPLLPCGVQVQGSPLASTDTRRKGRGVLFPHHVEGSLGSLFGLC